MTRNTFATPADRIGRTSKRAAETLEKGNDFGKPGYGGPCPPRGDKPHAYHFLLSALRDIIDDADPGTTCQEIKRLASPYEIEFSELIGFFGRKKKGH